VRPHDLYKVQVSVIKGRFLAERENELDQSDLCRCPSFEYCVIASADRRVPCRRRAGPSARGSSEITRRRRVARRRGGRQALELEGVGEKFRMDVCARPEPRLHLEGSARGEIAACLGAGTLDDLSVSAQDIPSTRHVANR